MIKRILFFYFPGLFLTMLVASCATIYPNEKLLIGKWNPVHAEEYVKPVAGKTGSMNAPKQPVKSNAPEQNNLSPSTGTESRANDKMIHMIQTELRSPFVVYANKTAEKNFPGKTVNANWKMKKKGTRVIAKNPETSKQLKIDILSISDSTLEVIEYSDAGNLKVKYIKDVK